MSSSFATTRKTGKNSSPTKKGKARPSLVILSTGDQPTSFQRKRFSMKEFTRHYFPGTGFEGLKIENEEGDDKIKKNQSSASQLNSNQKPTNSQRNDDDNKGFTSVSGNTFNTRTNPKTYGEMDEKSTQKDAIQSPSKIPIPSKNKAPKSPLRKAKHDFLMPQNDEDEDTSDPDLDLDSNMVEPWESQPEYSPTQNKELIKKVGNMKQSNDENNTDDYSEDDDDVSPLIQPQIDETSDQNIDENSSIDDDPVEDNDNINDQQDQLDNDLNSTQNTKLRDIEDEDQDNSGKKDKTASSQGRKSANLTDSKEDENPSADPFDVFRSPGDLGPDVPSVATSNFSTALDEDTMQNQFLKQINDEKIFFADNMFKGCNTHEQRQLSRIVRIQTSHRQHWIVNNWANFNNGNAAKEMLFNTINLTAQSIDAMMNWDFGLLQSASQELWKFMRSNPDLTPSYFVRACIEGPKQSGKTSFLRTMFLQHLINLAVSGLYKSTFVVTFDYRENKDSLHDIYDLFNYYCKQLINAVAAQRPDVSDYLPAIRKTIDSIPDGPPPQIPKPLTSQNYLRRPLCDLESLLGLFYDLLKENNYDRREEFIEEVTMMPVSIASIFGFSNVLIICDHIDYADTDIILSSDIKSDNKKINLLEKIKLCLQRTQYIISAEDGETILEKLQSSGSHDIDLARSTHVITVLNKCQTDSDVTIQVTRESDGKKLLITPELCCGCPSYVFFYEDIVRELGKISTLSGSQQKAAQKKLYTKVSILLSLVYDIPDEQYLKIDIADVDIVNK